MKKKICGVLNSSKNIFLRVEKLIIKNKKKVVIGLSVFLVVFISVFSFINLRYPTKINAYIAHVINKGEPANSYFDDENFYKAVVDAYNKENNTSLSYTTNLTDEQLKSIKSVSYWGNQKSDSEKIRSTTGIEKLTALTYLYLGCNKLSSIDLSKNTFLTYLYLENNELSNIDLSKNTKLTNLQLYNNPLKLNAYVKENGMLTNSNIKMPEGSDKFYLTYEIEDNSIANFADNRLNGLKVGKTSATVTLNGVKASSSSTENMKVDGTITVFDRLKGDISNDDKITIADVSLLYRHVRKTKVITDSKTLEVSDLTGDGKITIADVAKLYRYVRGKITEL